MTFIDYPRGALAETNLNLLIRGDTAERHRDNWHLVCAVPNWLYLFSPVAPVARSALYIRPVFRFGPVKSYERLSCHESKSTYYRVGMIGLKLTLKI
jgi:hypothetical protein